MFSSNSHNWDGLIVLCAANNYDTVKMADQHIAVELANWLLCCMSTLLYRASSPCGIERERGNLKAPGFAC